MDAVKGHHCQRSVGIDIHKPFVNISEKVKKYLDIENAAFYLATLDEMADNPERYGGPFQTVLLTGAYHYLFWGSKLCSDAYLSHERIFHKLSSVCSGRLIISGRFEVVFCQGYTDGGGRRTCQSGGSGGVRNPSSECGQADASLKRKSQIRHKGPYL